jgi:hypothetical protein
MREKQGPEIEKKIEEEGGENGKRARGAGLYSRLGGDGALNPIP